jgi:hypothetical protein
MKSRKVLSRKNIPSKLPIWNSLTCWLSLEYFKAPQWLYGAMGVLFVIIWTYCILYILTEKQTELPND